jgi:hypothetical protein
VTSSGADTLSRSTALTYMPSYTLAGESRLAFTDVSKQGTIGGRILSLIMPKQRDARRSNDNTGNARCGIVRHSTLWLKPILVGQFEFVEWTPDNHLRHSRFIAPREDKNPKNVTREG